MKRAQKVLIGAGVAIALGAVVAASLLGKEKAKGEPVYMAKAARKGLVSAVSATGRIEPKTKVNIQSSVIGEIVVLPVKEGQRVLKGELLVQLEPDRYRSEVEGLQATLRMNRIAVEQQEVSLENAVRTQRRNHELHARGIVSPELLERSDLEVRTGEINLKSLKEQVSQAGAALAKASDELRKTTITSPMDGIVTQLNAKLGEITLTGTMNNPGTVILVVSDMSEILAEVDVDETRIVKVEPGQTARVVVDAVGELHPYQGRVAEIAGTAVKRPGQEIQVFPVKIALDLPDGRLRPGMTSKARIETERADAAITVPIQAVLHRPAKQVSEILAKRGEEPAAEPANPRPRQDTGAATEEEDKREVVFVVKDGKAVLTPVRTGLSDESDVVVLDGLTPGDTVVTGPYRAVKKLKDGDQVREKGEKQEEEEGKEGAQESKGSPSEDGEED